MLPEGYPALRTFFAKVSTHMLDISGKGQWRPILLFSITLSEASVRQYHNMIIGRKIKSIYSIILLSIFLVEVSVAFHGKDLVCEKCHVMHYSEDGTPLPDGEGPFEHLLVKERSTELCLTCHDGKADVPDVVLTQSV